MSDSQLSEIWIPKGGWSAAWSDQEQLQATSLFSLLRQKNYPAPQAEVLVHMAMNKKKYSIRYADEQEKALERALPISSLPSPSPLPSSPSSLSPPSSFSPPSSMMLSTKSFVRKQHQAPHRQKEQPSRHHHPLQRHPTR